MDVIIKEVYYGTSVDKKGGQKSREVHKDVAEY